MLKYVGTITAKVENGGELPLYTIEEINLNIIEVEITNKNMSAVNANQSMQFDCPNCKHNQIKAAWNYVHNYCPHCGAKIIWNTDPEPIKIFD